eukprot:Tbor_TRINITY_DN3248_c0_g1::TRINITY_DN3248_c0_g1_i2::g.23702::m.23702
MLKNNIKTGTRLLSLLPHLSNRNTPHMAHINKHINIPYMTCYVGIYISTIRLFHSNTLLLSPQDITLNGSNWRCIEIEVEMKKNMPISSFTSSNNNVENTRQVSPLSSPQPQKYDKNKNINDSNNIIKSTPLCRNHFNIYIIPMLHIASISFYQKVLQFIANECTLRNGKSISSDSTLSYKDSTKASHNLGLDAPNNNNINNINNNKILSIIVEGVHESEEEKRNSIEEFRTIFYDNKYKGYGKLGSSKDRG